MLKVAESGLGYRVHLAEPHQSGRPRHSEIPLNANDVDRVNQARRQSDLFGEPHIGMVQEGARGRSGQIRPQRSLVGGDVQRFAHRTKIGDRPDTEAQVGTYFPRLGSNVVLLDVLRSLDEINSLGGRASNTVGVVAKATVRLYDEDRQLLERLAPKFGGREETLREALRRLAADQDRREALSAFLAEWARECGPPDEEAVAAMAERYGL